ncbi:hypothetical protein KHP60_04670 [Microvirga sp. 3-52]|uniref:hypothetical protein n=1 Tax=Microvirga sp. 3-52 TaxID=2792425 RepID=UPI001AC03A63|nr:hypothetical protein [Microvirga sp. 3-52]MBO1904028.1 hypothetical protein [Microvirga sp. 3-52]MBS7451639.1 hypothetical protein [Microvirga sp. 3-52]
MKGSLFESFGNPFPSITDADFGFGRPKRRSEDQKPSEVTTVDPTSRLLNARNRAGRTVIEIVADDLAAHGPQVIPTLRDRDPVAYTRLLSDLVAFKPLLRSQASPDKPVPAVGEATTRERLAEHLLEIVAADFAQHGSQVVERLRTTNTSAYARFIGECVQFRMLTAERAPRKNPSKPRREPRQVRVNNLLKAAYDGPIDVNNPKLPERWVNRWVEEELALKELGLSAFDLTPEELSDRWPKRLASWFEKQVRGKVQMKSSNGKMARTV